MRYRCKTPPPPTQRRRIARKTDKNEEEADNAEKKTCSTKGYVPPGLATPPGQDLIATSQEAEASGSEPKKRRIATAELADTSMDDLTYRLEKPAKNDEAELADTSMDDWTCRQHKPAKYEEIENGEADRLEADAPKEA